MQTRRGLSIESESMKIIDGEIGEHHYDDTQWPIVRRIIHSTADFDFARDNAILFSHDAVSSGTDALRGGCHIIADVNGILGLLNKSNLARYHNDVICRISEPAIADMAKKMDSTRARVSMRQAAGIMAGSVVVIGNAPTALLELLDMMQEGIRPALVVALPVGFVQAAESKALLAERSPVPYITNVGRKGGSSSAAAVINALYLLS